MDLPKGWKVEIIDSGDKCEVEVSYKGENARGETLVQAFINQKCSDRAQKIAILKAYAVGLKRLRNIAVNLEALPKPSPPKKPPNAVAIARLSSSSRTSPNLPTNAAPAPRKGLLVCKHCKLPVTSNREKLLSHEMQCVSTQAFSSQNDTLSQSSQPRSGTNAKKRSIAAISKKPSTGSATDNDDECAAEVGLKAVWKAGTVQAVHGPDSLSISLKGNNGAESAIFSCSDVRLKSSIGWAWVQEPIGGEEQSSGNKYSTITPVTVYKVGQRVDVRVLVPDPKSTKQKQQPEPAGKDIRRNKSKEAVTSAGDSKKKTKPKSADASSVSETNTHRRKAKQVGEIPHGSRRTAAHSATTATTTSAAKVRRLVGGRTVGEPSAGSLPSVRHLQAYVNAEGMYYKQNVHMQSMRKLQNELLEKYEKEFFLNWLSLLQYHFNILCFGVGCKKNLMTSFASKMLVDEDVIQINFNCGRNSALFDSQVVDNTVHSAGRDVIGDGGGQIRATGTGTRNEHTNLIWDLLRMIRVRVLGQPQYQVSAVEWCCPHEGAPSPVENEAKLVSELLKTHYGWWKSTEGRGQSGLSTFESGVFISLAGSGNWTRTVDDDEKEECEGSITMGGGEDGVLTEDKQASRMEDYDDVEEMKGDVERGSPGRVTRSSDGQRKQEVTNLINSHHASGEANVAYCNSISRLYLIIHNIEEAFPQSYGHGKFPSETYIDVQKALSVLAECPVVSIVASMTHVNGPLHLGWDSLMLTRFNWQYFHTPTFVDHDILPELVRACAAASSRSGTETGRGAKALKYILRSLTKKHCDVLKYLLKAQESANQKVDGQSAGGSSDTNSKVAATAATPVGKSPAVMWTVLLSQCVNQFIVKTDSELRQLISELKDQRIVRSYPDADGVLMVSLVLSPGEIRSALEYFAGKKIAS